ncbi:MAG: hypothetical protein ACI9IJ_002314 [Psychromonas sp.]|jgi:hypothetical protein
MWMYCQRNTSYTRISMVNGYSVWCAAGGTVIFPMLRSIKPQKKLASMLRWKALIIDLNAALLAVLVFEYISFSSEPMVHILSA